ncbi:MAG TPA: hypothetical protein VGK27_05345 [Candidatus Deferrimicrobiaceae bacterium]
MAPKKIILTICGQNHVRPDWRVRLSGKSFDAFCNEVAAGLAPYGIAFEVARNRDLVIDIRSYADLLNAVRVSSPSDGCSNRCVGHIIGKSEKLDLLEDIRAAVDRIAFAPETVPPDDFIPRVCHNCGCGC